MSATNDDRLLHLCRWRTCLDDPFVELDLSTAQVDDAALARLGPGLQRALLAMAGAGDASEPATHPARTTMARANRMTIYTLLMNARPEAFVTCQGCSPYLSQQAPSACRSHVARGAPFGAPFC